MDFGCGDPHCEPIPGVVGTVHWAPGGGQDEKPGPVPGVVAQSGWSCPAVMALVRPLRISQLLYQPCTTATPWEWVHVDYAGPFMGSMYFILVDSHLSGLRWN